MEVKECFETLTKPTVSIVGPKQRANDRSGIYSPMRKLAHSYEIDKFCDWKTDNIWVKRKRILSIFLESATLGMKYHG